MMSLQNFLKQFKSLAEKHLGDPVDAVDTKEDEQLTFTFPAKDKVKAVIDDFLSVSPLIQEAGYKITNLEIELGLIPKLIPHFNKEFDIDKDKRSLLLAQLENKKLMRMLLSALFKADDFQKSLNMKNYHFKGIEIEITALPAIRLNYQHLSLSEIKSTEIVPET